MSSNDLFSHTCKNQVTFSPDVLIRKAYFYVQTINSIMRYGLLQSLMVTAISPLSALLCFKHIIAAFEKQ